MNRTFTPTISSSHFSVRSAFASIALVAAAVVNGSTALAQVPATRPQAPATSPAAARPSTFSPAPAAAQQPAVNQASPIDQAQADREWLTAYFMVHQGYKLHHMPAIDATLNKMTPTQLHTLREMYDEKHSTMMQQQAVFHQWNAQKVAQAQSWNQRQQRLMGQINTEASQSANVEEQQINQMHQEAAANAEMKSLSYPGMYGPYGSPFGYGGGYVHPYFNPLAY